MTDAGAVGQQPQGYLRPREHRLEIVDEAATTTGSGTRAASTQHSEIIACAHTDDTVDDIRDGGRGSARQRWSWRSSAEKISAVPDRIVTMRPKA